VVHRAAAIVRVLEDDNEETDSTAVVKDSEMLTLYSIKHEQNVVGV